MIRSSVMLFCVLTAVTRVDAVENRIIATVSTSQSHAEIHSHAQFVRRSIQPEWMHLAWLDIGAIRGKDVKSVSVNGHTLYPQADNHTRYAMHLAGDSVIANVHVTFEREKAWSSEFLARAGQTYALHFHAAGAALLFADVSQATIEKRIVDAKSSRRALVSELKREEAKREQTKADIASAKLKGDEIQKLILQINASIQILSAESQTKERAAVQAESQADAACRLNDSARQELDKQNTLFDLVSDLEKRTQGQQNLAAKVLLAEVAQRQKAAKSALDLAEPACNAAAATATDQRTQANVAKNRLHQQEQAKQRAESELKTNDDSMKMSSGKLEEIENRIRELTEKIGMKTIEIQTLQGLLPPQAPPPAPSETPPDAAPETPPAPSDTPPEAPPGTPPAPSDAPPDATPGAPSAVPSET